MSASNSKINLGSSVTVTAASGEKSRMKQFIAAAQEFNRTKSEETASILSRTLQLIGVSLDINTFDPNSSVVAEFFVSLHELMSNLDARSPLVWFAVTVLQQACRNQAAHRALIHTYQFLPILSKALGDHLTRDKKRKLLTLMQELSYGINISWQISYLPQLLTTLARWIETGDEGITSLSLGVLLNICHRNLPVIYTFMRTVNTKHFLKTVMAMKNPATEVQVCKLLIILEHINGEVPKEDLLNFVRVTFRTIVEAFESKDLIRLRHIVEFFLEVRGQKNRVDAVISYDSYYNDVERILNAVENTIKMEPNIATNEIIREREREQNDLECMSLLFEFLHSLVELRVPQLSVLHGRMVRMTIGWVQTEMVCAKALALLRSIAVQPENPEQHLHEQQLILEPLASGLSVLLHIVDTAVPAGDLLHSEQCHKLTALFQLLRVLACNDILQSRVFATLKQSSILRVFDALLGADNELISCASSNVSSSIGGCSTGNTGLGPICCTSSSNNGSGEHILYVKEGFTSDLNELYVHAVALVCALATYSEQWEPVLNRVFTHRQVHAVLAQAFYADTQPETKLLVFKMARMRNFPLQEIAHIMCEMQPGGPGPAISLGLGIGSHSSIAHSIYGGGCSSQTLNSLQHNSVSSCCGFNHYTEGSYGCGPSIMSGAQIEQLDRLIEKLNEALANNQVQNIATSEVMELYEYKMAAIGHAERAAQASLEAANQQSTHLQHRLAQMSTEVSRLHQMLFHAQQCAEENRRQIRSSEETIASLTARFTKEQVRSKELAQQLVERERCVDDQQAGIQLLEEKIKEHVQNHNFLSKKYEDQVNKNIALVKASAGIENNMASLQKSLDEKNTALNKLTLKIETLSQQVNDLESLRKQHEQTIAIRDKELQDTNRELEDRRRIIDTITKLTRS